MAVTQHEYYIRQPSETEASGPFTFAQISSLVDRGEIDVRTLYFDASNEQWIPLAGSSELGILLPKGAPASHKAPHASSQPSTGASRFVVILLFASAVVFFLPAFVLQQVADSLLGNPFLWLGVLDALLALGVLILSAKFFPVIRLRAALGLGFLCVLFWLQANVCALACAVVASVCLWLATVFVSRRGLAANVTAGLAALAALAYCLLK